MGDTLFDHRVVTDKKHECPIENHVEEQELSSADNLGKVHENGKDTMTSHSADMNMVSRCLHPDSQDIADRETESQSVEELDGEECSFDDLQHSFNAMGSSVESQPPNLEHEEPSTATCNENFVGPAESREVANALSIQSVSGNGELNEVSKGLVHSLSGEGDVEEASEVPVQSHECLEPPARGCDNFVQSGIGLPHAHVEVVVLTTPSEGDKSASQVNGVCETSILHTNSRDGHQESDSFKSPNEGNIMTGLVSTVVEEWQRFDTDTDEATLAYGFVHTPLGGHARAGLETWEQLLEDGSSEKNACNVTSQMEAEVGVDSQSHDRIVFWLSSPGNPFVENLDRVSSFSEAEGFLTNGSLPAHFFDTKTSLPFKDGQLHSEYSNGDYVPGMSCTIPATPEEEKLSNEMDGCEHGSKRQWQARFPSFSDIRSSSKSHYFDSLPALEASKDESKLECGGERWEAVFDSPPPTVTSAAHEAGRSLSLPREAIQRGQRTDTSISSKEGRPSGFASPKLSPLVKKVVSKIRTTPDRVLSTVSKAIDKKEHKTPMWRSCFCCSHA